jgi:hypothetical protein
MPPLECKKGTAIEIPSNSEESEGKAPKQVDKLLSTKDATTEF